MTIFDLDREIAIDKCLPLRDREEIPGTRGYSTVRGVNALHELRVIHAW